jgi:uncharacterized protein
VRLLGPHLNRSEDAVDIKEDSRPIRLGAQAGEQGFGLHRSYDRGVRLVLIGLVAGFFSALFGIGGGLVIVPLLLLLADFDERPAMATSLAAIGLIALVGTATYAWHDEVRVAHAALLGIPAALGAVGGAALQQRLGNRALAFAFAGLLAGVGITLLF